MIGEPRKHTANLKFFILPTFSVAVTVSLSGAVEGDLRWFLRKSGEAKKPISRHEWP